LVTSVIATVKKHSEKAFGKAAKVIGEFGQLARAG
jgi:hypothetical protein